MCIDPRTHYVMIGIAVRIAIRLGLHKDGAQLGVCPFETEERRRLWWNLVALDKRVAETTGAAVTAMSTPRADCKRPLNLNDSDLYVDAKQAPVVSDSSTEMVFCLARYELAATAAPEYVNQKAGALCDPQRFHRRVPSTHTFVTSRHANSSAYCF